MPLPRRTWQALLGGTRVNASVCFAQGAVAHTYQAEPRPDTSAEQAVT